MNLHEDKKLFADAVLATAQYLDIKPIFVEKDYWITRSLKMLVAADDGNRAIFKGGTSLSKAHNIGARFSEDIDVAIIDAASLNGNQKKMLIKRLAKAMTYGLEEISVPGVTSKGSSYHKAIYGYDRISELEDPLIDTSIKLGQIMVEINTFSNPYPYNECTIDNFIGMFLRATGNVDIIGQYGIDPFCIKVLDKRRTATEKIVSLIRFSLASDYEEELTKKIRHFYDLYFLMEDEECHEYFYSEEFVKDLESLLQHDRDLFSQPEGWNQRPLCDSPLFNSIDRIWDSRLSQVYNYELSSLAYKSIPDSQAVLKNIKSIMDRIKSFGYNLIN